MARRKADSGKANSDHDTPAPAPNQETAADAPFYIVAVGSSAGGLEAFEAFFAGMPADIDVGMAFVLVQHLSPDHESSLTSIVQRSTRMHVQQVTDGTVVRPDHVYVIPPNKDMTLFGGVLQLLDPTAPRGRRMPIDYLFRSLARDWRERAIGVVLSGTGTDGTLGVRAIKGEGGMVMVQSPASAAFDGMPRSALDTRLADYELPPTKMASALLAYASHAPLKSPRGETVDVPKNGSLAKLYALIRTSTGHDFSGYKLSTVQRRVERRMAVHQIGTLDGDVRFVQRSEDEVHALFRDMLIGVTSFFRDPEASAVIENDIVPTILSRQRSNETVRIWVPACSTGEEAYSLAMLLAERQEELARRFTIKVFATDIDSEAIGVARKGVYPASISTDVTPDRLARFFAYDAAERTYRVHPAVRDMLVFSEQNVISDPPFSGLDLVSCRNVLIYLDSKVQKQIIPLFHYALKPGGYLILGKSEGVGETSGLFETTDRTQKIYQRAAGPAVVQWAGSDRLRGPGHLSARSLAVASPFAKSADRSPASLREITEQALLKHAAQVGILVTDTGTIRYVHGRAGMYLEPAPGESGPNNILSMAREGLHQDLAIALHQAVKSGATAARLNVRVRTNGDFTNVDVTVIAVPVSHPALFLVILSEHVVAATGPPVAPDGVGAEPRNAESAISALQKEIQARDDYLKMATETNASTNEELRSANEEMQAINEELQSANEELQTSKEEIQSVNEELATVNAELQATVMNLTRANNDMNNLLAGTGIATVFVDQQVCVMRFTPAVTEIINLMEGDIGRPLSHIVANLVDYPSMNDDIHAVLDTLEVREEDVRTTAGRWFRMHIQPYRTLENVVEGAVLTFTNVDELRSLQASLEAQSDGSDR